jgi:PPM family protein phosphatase
VEAFAEAFRGTGPAASGPSPAPGLEDRLRAAVEAANAAVFAAARASSRLRGMGTTVVAASFDLAGICVAHVGDSRAYRIRGGTIERLTQDHSLFEAVRAMRSDPTFGEDDFPQKNVILRAVGVAPSVVADVKRERVRSGDGFLLCSDGLSGMIDDASILDAVLRNPAPRAAVDDLVERANQAGGADNISAVLIQCAPA